MLRDSERKFIDGACIFLICILLAAVLYCKLTRVTVSYEEPSKAETKDSYSINFPDFDDWDTVNWGAIDLAQREYESNTIKSNMEFEKYVKEHPVPDYLVTNQNNNEKTTDFVSNDDTYNDINKDDTDIEENLMGISYSNEDLFKFEATLYAECGAQGTSRQMQVANAWIARNKIEQELANGSSDPFREALNPNHYQGVYDDEFGWRAVSKKEGTISQDLINSNPSIHEVSVGVLNGDIPSPIYDWDCCIACKTYDFDKVVETAESFGLVNYFVIENGIFFPSSEWSISIDHFLASF